MLKYWNFSANVKFWSWNFAYDRLFSPVVDGQFALYFKDTICIEFRFSFEVTPIFQHRIKLPTVLKRFSKVKQ